MFIISLNLYYIVLNLMYFLYADESGDTGLVNSPTNYFCLSGLIIHESKWNAVLEDKINFRRNLKDKYGLKLREEIHAAAYIHKPKDLKKIHKSLRLKILRDAIDLEVSMQKKSMMTTINVVVEKQKQLKNAAIFTIAWTKLIHEFCNQLSDINPFEKAMLIVDRTDEVQLRNITRNMLRNKTNLLIEDAIHRDSHHSYFIQLADINAYFLYQKYEACAYIRKKGATNYFDRLSSKSIFVI